MWKDGIVQTRRDWDNRWSFVECYYIGNGELLPENVSLSRSRSDLGNLWRKEQKRGSLSVITDAIFLERGLSLFCCRELTKESFHRFAASLLFSRRTYTSAIISICEHNRLPHNHVVREQKACVTKQLERDSDAVISDRGRQSHSFTSLTRLCYYFPFSSPISS